MRHEADCWIAACAMAIGVPYETIEEYFGSGAEYSAKTLESDDKAMRMMYNHARMFAQILMFIDHGCYPLLLTDVNPEFQQGRRYLLSGKSADPQHPYMAHTFVVEETGKIFDPDSNCNPAETPSSSLEKYPDIVGWEIIKLPK
jgi:hypothetical protein